MTASIPFLPLIAGATLSLLAFAHAGEEALFRENFSSYETGSKPIHPNDNSPFPWNFHPGLEAVVEEGELPPDASEGAKTLRLRNTRSEVVPNIQRLFDPIGDENTKLRFRMKVRIHQFDSSAYYLFFTSTSQPQYGPTIVFESNGALVILHSENQPGDNTVRTLSPHGRKLDLNTWYAIEINADLKAQTFSVSVANLERSGQSGATTSLLFLNSIPTLDQLFIRPAKRNAPITSSLLDWELTDIELTSLP